jgi:hypothetical protein
MDALKRRSQRIYIPPPNRSVERAKWHEKRAIIFMDFVIYVAHFSFFMGFLYI